MAEKNEKTAASTEVAVVKNAGLPTTDLVSADLLMEDSGSGSEFISTRDMMIPFVSVLQSLSPQVNKRDGAYVQGAEAGMFFNTATQAIYDGEKGILVVPCIYMRKFTEWNLREKGGGLVADHGQNESVMNGTTRDDKGRNMTPSGTQIVESAVYYCLLIDEELGGFERVVVSLGGTQMKKSRRWNTLMMSLQAKRPDGKGTFNPAIFYQAYRLTSVPESNDKGNWMGVNVKSEKATLTLENGDEIYLAARAFKDAVNQGLVKTAEQHPDATAPSEAGGNGQEVPF